MRIAAKIACIGLIGTLTACSSLNPFARKPSPRSTPAPLVAFSNAMGVRTVWTAPVGNAGKYAFSPAAVSGSIFAAAADGTIMRVEAATGRALWRINAGMRLTAGVGSDGYTVAVGGADGVLLVYDGEGKLRWKTQASSEILSAPAVGQGLVIVRSLDNRIVAYDAESGARRWTVQRTAPALTLRSAPGILIAGPTAFFALPGGKLLALALSNGAVRWEAVVADPRGATELERIADVSGLPVLVGREICAVAYQGRIACFDAVTGAGRWAKKYSSDVGLAADERFVFAADESGTVNAFTRDTGVSVWRNDKLAHRRLSAPISIGRAVAVGDYQGYMHFLAREDGAFLARVPTDGSAIISTPVAAAGYVIVQTQAGALVALATE